MGSEEVKEKKPNKYVEGFKGFCTFLYNPDDHTVFGRGGSSWGKILVFYFFFYSCLAAFFAVCLIVMLQTLDPAKPTIVGRTNKPMVSTPFPKMYTLNFKDANYWQNQYKGKTDKDGGFLNLIKLYEDNNERNITKGDNKFVWSDKTMGDCANSANADIRSKGCIFVTLNRIWNWNIPEDSTVSFKCDWDAGKTGKGNTDPPFDIIAQPVGRENVISDIISTYYPWTSMEEKGLQPIQAFKIQFNKEKAGKMAEDASLETYLQCTAVVNGVDPLEGVGPANFEIIYDPETMLSY